MWTPKRVQVLVVELHVSRVSSVGSDWLSVAVALQCILLLFRLQ